MSSDNQPKAGDICPNCEPRWKKRKKKPLVLRELPNKTELGLTVVVCDYCDGPTREIAERAKDATESD